MTYRPCDWRHWRLSQKRLANDIWEFSDTIYNEIMGCIKRDYIYSLLYECVNYVSIYLWAVWNFSGPFYLSFDVFFLSVNLLLWQEPWKKGKLIVKKPVPGSSLKEKNLLACMADSKRALFARVFTAPKSFAPPGLRRVIRQNGWL